MRWLGFLTLWGCSFHGSSVGLSADDASAGPDGAQPLIDARPLDARPLDARPLDAQATLCTFATTGTLASGGSLGGGGGSPAANLTCQPGEFPVGFAFDVTTGTPPQWTEVAVTGIHLRCAQLVDTSAGPTTVTAELVDHVSGACGASGGHSWASGPVAELDCPAGNALVGLTGNADRNGSTLSMFNTVAMQCAPVMMNGQLGAATTITFATGTNTDHMQTAACPANTVIVSFTSRAGCGQDQLSPQCAPITCQ